MGAALVVAAVLLVSLLHRSLLRDVDARARLRLQDVAAVAARGQLPATLAGGDEDGTTAQLVAGGRVVAQSPLAGAPAPIASFVPAPGRVAVRTVRHTPIPGDVPRRVAAQRVDTPAGPAVAYVAASLEPVSDSIHALEALLALAVPLLLVLVGGTTWWLVGRTLRPVEAMRRQVAEISAAELDRRVPEPATGDEIHRLAETMNTMLGRLEEAMARQRSFVSDAAHELRSPLAVIRAELDVAASHLETADWPALVERLGATATRMERLVEDLLLLATAEERGPRPRSEVDLDDVVVGQLQPLRTATRLTVDVHGLNAARVWGDRQQLEQVVANLLDNAMRHARTTIAVALGVDGGTAELVIADDGPGVPAEHRDRVFDRFARVDEARARQGGGAGLGLAIARRIVGNHGGSIAFDGTAQGARLVVRLPVGSNGDSGLNGGGRSG
jgi:signal transduction histidine kinase